MGIWKFLNAATDDIKLGDIYSNTLHPATLMSSLSVILLDGNLPFHLRNIKER
jgi:hypothetical protein